MCYDKEIPMRVMVPSILMGMYVAYKMRPTGKPRGYYSDPMDSLGMRIFFSALGAGVGAVVGAVGIVAVIPVATAVLFEEIEITKK